MLRLSRGGAPLRPVLAQARRWLDDTWPDPTPRRMAGICMAATLVLTTVGAGSAMAGARRASAAGGTGAAVVTITPRGARLVRAPAPPTGATPAPAVNQAAAGNPAAPVAAAVPLAALPVGKGMWIWQPEHAEAGDVRAIVDRARAVGLTHLYARTGSSWDGFDGAPFLQRLLPAAHAAGIRVYGWDFPRLVDWKADVGRAVAAAAYQTPGGHTLDGFAADIETASEGTHINGPVALAYGQALRQAVGAGYPLVAVVPRPSPERAAYPYAEVVRDFDAIAPMVYWLNREPGADVAGVLANLRRFAKPVLPVGQAYDGAAEGGRRGVPPPAELLRFMQVAADGGAAGVSFWSWQHANTQAWSAIHDALAFRADKKTPRAT